jgi:hypothetical protein
MLAFRARRRKKKAEPCGFDLRDVCGRPSIVSPANRIAIVSGMRRFDAPSGASPLQAADARIGLS